jgi:hypothetical protein
MDTPRNMPVAPPRRLGLALVILGALAIAIATLRPTPEMADRAALLPLTCLVCGEVGGTDVVLNLLLFAPFAAGLALLGLRTRRVLVIAALVSLTIETLQFAWVPGRDASLSDLLTNSIGAAIVAWLVHRRSGFLRPNPRRAGWLSLAGVLAWVSLEVAAAWSLQPSLPETSYWGQWAPDLGFLDRFRGTVLGAAVAGDSLPPHRLTGSEVVRRQLLQSGGPVTARAITGDPPQNLAPIVSVFDGRSTEIFLLGQRRKEAVFRLRTRVADLRLRPPAIRIPNAVPATPGDSLVLSASYAAGRYSLRVEARGQTAERTLAATPNWAWSYFMPFGDYALGEDARWLTALWVAGLLLPIGFWASRSGTCSVIVAVWAGIVLTLALVPRIFDLPSLHPSEYLAAAAGLILGQLTARSSNRG